MACRDYNAASPKIRISFQGRTELVNRRAGVLRCGAVKIGYFGYQRTPS